MVPAITRKIFQPSRLGFLFISSCVAQKTAFSVCFSSIRKYGGFRLFSSCCGYHQYQSLHSFSAKASNVVLIRKLQSFGSCCNHQRYQSLQSFSTKVTLNELCWEASSNVVLIRKLEFALREYQLDKAWEAFNDFKTLYGFPTCSLVSRLINEFSYSSDKRFLKKACDLVLMIWKEKQELLRVEDLAKLSLSLARAQMPVPSAMIFRLMLEKECLPSMNAFLLIVLHLVKTDIGTCLASNILVEVCNCFQHLNPERGRRAESVKPGTMIYNLVLDACVRCGSSFKGQQIIELMSRTGVVADAHTIVLIARIHEINGLRDEVNRFKHHISNVSFSFLHHYWQFYDSLLNLHFLFDDVDAAAELVLDICRPQDSSKKDDNGFRKQCSVSIGSKHLRDGLKVKIAPTMLQKDFVLEVQSTPLASFTHGRIVLSNKALAKLISRFKRCGRIHELSKLLFSIQAPGPSSDSSVCSDVIDACLNLGWLETAHDILDDSAAAGYALGFTTYKSLLSAYLKRNMSREAKALLKQMKKVGFFVNLPEEIVFSMCSPEVVEKHDIHALKTEGSDLAQSLYLELTDEENATPSTLYELNSSIYFFSQAKMIEDALRTYRKMQVLDIQPTVHTFAFLAHGYSSLEMYREITHLWGDIKRNMVNGNLVVSSDLYEFLLLNFIRGGYFERVMEVIHCMQERNLYIDKWFCKKEFLKLHRNLYRNMTALETRTEAQTKRLGYVQAFRKWACID